MRNARPLLALACALGLLSCAEQQSSENDAQSGFTLKSIPSFESSLWTGDLDRESDPIVATVNGTPITVSMLQRQLDRSEPGRDPGATLDRMIEFELLAREAFQAGKYTTDIVKLPMQQALANRWMHTTFDEEISPKDIPQDMVNQGYKNVQNFYDHYEGFKLLDVQIMCCMDTFDQDNCYRDQLEDVADRRQRLDDCLNHHKQSVQELHNLLSTEAAMKDRDSFEEAVRAMEANFPSQALRDQYATTAVLHEYNFQYDVDRTYEAQFVKIRYAMFFQEIMDGVRDAYLANQSKAPFLTPIIRSPIGWHILFGYEVSPERHQTVDDPEVNTQIREKLFDAWRTQRKYPEVIHNLCVNQGCGTEFCTEWLRHWVCVEKIRTTKEHSSQEIIRKQCDSLLIADIQPLSDGCFLQAYRIVPLQELHEKK